jgi:ATP-dependent RNA helicase DeaD
VAREIDRLSKYKDLHVAVVHGGVPYEPQIESMNKATVVVGTPGRTLDHLRKGNLDLSSIEIFILDEVDRMLDMGFIDDVTAIMEYCPEYRQNLFFSATLSTRVNRIAEKLGDDPVEVSVNNQVDPSKLTQVYYDIPDNIKFSLLHHLLKEEQSDLVMVFCNTRNTTDFVAKNLKAHGIDAYAIHGGFSQNQRNKRMNQFKEGDVTVLVCTDVAARGIDVDNVTHIYNYDIPSDPKQYVHRIGRTARAGEDGKAINILGGRDHDNFRRVMRHHSHHIDRVEPPRVERLDIKWTP